MRPLGVEHTALTQQVLKEQGTDLTMDEIRVLRKKAFDKIRKFMREAGHDMPDDDVELMKLIKTSMSEREKGTDE